MHHISFTFAFVALGSNQALGDASPAAVLRGASGALARVEGVTLLRESAQYRSPAWPIGSGPDFVNAVVGIATCLTPHALLSALHRIEALYLRERDTRWAARSLDLDLLAYGGAVVPDAATLQAWIDLPSGTQARIAPDQLILPHPRLQDRGFVLIPWAEIAPDWHHPITGASVAEMRDALPAAARSGVVPLPA